VRRYDLAVLGGGSAGLIAAVGAARLGARVVLVERERTGGECLWTGCVPSKSLLATADLAHRMRAARDVGLAPAEPEIDLARVMARVRQAQASIAVHDAPQRLRAEGVEVVHGEGRFEAPGRLVVGGRVLAYRRALVATGSRPLLPGVPGLEAADPLTTDTVWELDALPQRLVVLGGGATGCELAQAFARLGSAVTLVEMSDRLLSVEEPEAGTLIAQRLRAEGVEVCTGTRAEELDGRTLTLTDGRRLPFDRILVATGRAPCSEGLGLEAIGAGTAHDGAVQVDATLRTTARGVFAAGDVTGMLPFTHVAGHQAATVVPNALFHARRRFDAAAMPWVTFTAPEVARVGLTEARARARHGGVVRVARHDYAQVDRAVTAASTDGFAKLIVGRRGRLLGATVAAPAAGEAIAALASLMAGGGTVGRIASAVHPYPTFGEGPARAAQEHLSAVYLGERTRRLTRPLLALLRAAERLR
jgi:pyruvate/2-oxoglutarate dehydrogenase complex dihydrolipoamide dehydrogenase (E3) component